MFLLGNGNLRNILYGLSITFLSHTVEKSKHYKELFSSGGVSTNEVVALKLSILNWKVALSSFRLKLSNSRAYLLQIFFYNSQELWLVT